MDKEYKLSETQKDVLIQVLREPGISQSVIRDALDLSRSGMSEAVTDLEEKGLVDVERNDGRSNLLELTRNGYRVALTLKESNGGVGSGGDELDVNLHNFEVKFPIENVDELVDGWRERWCQGKVDRYQWKPSNDSYNYLVDDWTFRITGKHVIVRLENGVYGDSGQNVKDRAFVEVAQAREWLESNSPVELSSSPRKLDIWVSRQHLAILRDPLAGIVKRHDSLDMDDVRIYGKNGEERLWLDDSEGEEHLEAGNSPGENREFAEDDIDAIVEELYPWAIDDREGLERTKEYGRDRDKVMAALRYVLSKEKERLDDSTGSGDREVSESGENRTDRMAYLAGGREEAKDSGRTDDFSESSGFSRARELSEILDISRKWIDQHGNLVGYAEEIRRQVKLVDSEVMWS